MNANLKAKWLEALRGGLYKQTTGVLRAPDCNGNGYCCLGVLADVYKPDLWTEEPQESEDEYGDYREIDSWMHAFSGELLSDDVLHSVGLDHEQQAKLASMNDQGQSFEQIAEYIEEEDYGSYDVSGDGRHG